jgi:hypothetical protein
MPSDTRSDMVSPMFWYFLQTDTTSRMFDLTMRCLAAAAAARAAPNSAADGAPTAAAHSASLGARPSSAASARPASS